MSTGFIKASGPDCPGCGCNATSLVSAGESFGRPWAKYGCDFCRKTFTVGRPPVAGEVVNGVVYQTVRCVCPNPQCKAKNPRVVNTSGKYRWHKCDKCGQSFKSVES
jgi:hypothetical protein